jgi:hypothetical protein
MPRVTVFLVCTLLGLVILATTSMLNPAPVLAAPGVLQFDASLQDGPQDTANSLSWLPAGTEVYVTGDQVTGYYPVTVGVLTGWVTAAALVLEEPSPVTIIEPAAATPVGAMTAPEQAPAAVPVSEPPLDPNAPSVAVPDPGPVGPAAVMADVAIYAGPGAEFGVLGTAAMGQLVEQTGHAVSGYVTVRYVGVTGWVPLDHLGPPPATANSSTVQQTDAQS